MILIEKMKETPFSQAEEAVVSFLLDQGSAIDGMTTREIAKKTYTAPSTIVRVVHKLNFSGWLEFKKAFLKEIHYLDNHTSHIDVNFPFGPDDSYRTLASNLTQVKQYTLQDTQELLDFDQFERAIDSLYQADDIHLFAVSKNTLFVDEFAYNMRYLSKSVHVHKIDHDMLTEAYLMHPNSLAILISYTGETPILIDCQLISRKMKIPNLVLTTIGDNSMTSKADIILRIASRERIYSKIASFSVDTSVSYLLDLLYAGLFQKDFAANLERKISISSKTESRSVTTKHISENKSN